MVCKKPGILWTAGNTVDMAVEAMCWIPAETLTGKVTQSNTFRNTQ